MKAMRDVWGDTLVALGETNPNLLVLDADLANSTKADKFAKAHPDRFLQMGIAEQNLVGVAVGLASVGFVPWLSSFAVFFTHRAVDPIRMLVAQTHANVKSEAAIRWATDYLGPVYLRLARDVCPDVFDSQYHFTPGKTYLLKEGKDVLLVSTGPQSARCKEAAELLEEQGVSAAVLHVPFIKPFNVQELVQVCEPFKLVVTVEEHNVMGGLGALVAEILSAHSPRKVIRFGVEDRWGESAPNDYLLDLFQLSPTRLSGRVKQVVQGTNE